MNYRMVLYVLGRIFLVEAALLVIPLACALLYGENTWLYFLIPIAALVLLGGALGLRRPKNTTIYARDGLVVAALAWVLLSAFGALPFYLSREIPSYTDAFFEMVSGFTTTGSTILTDVEAMSHGMLFWRSFSHWVGGMGVLVFLMAVLPLTDGRAMHLMRAEVPGPSVGKISSRLQDSAKILYKIYLVMTVLEVVLLCLGGMPLFDSLIHSFGSAGTGGFSSRALSVGAYNSPYAEWVIGIFMLLFGINFNLYYFLLLRHFKEALLSEELLVYLGIVALSTAAITSNILHLCDGFGQAVRLAFFQVSSIITTHRLCHHRLQPLALVLAHDPGHAHVHRRLRGFHGGRPQGLARGHPVQVRRAGGPPHAAPPRRHHGPLRGQTAGRAHGQRYRRVSHRLHPDLRRVGGRALVRRLRPHHDLHGGGDLLQQRRPRPGDRRPHGLFCGFSPWCKWLLSFDMLAGRLELFPMLALFSPRTWRPHRAPRTVVHL